jgi:hydroxymethylglutaryl-CoA lyase
VIRIVEVGPRDGLQNEATSILVSSKLDFANALVDAGLKEIEATSFVSPRWVPQLGDAETLWPRLPHDRALFSALIPNMKGLERAIGLKVGRIALFTAASDAFTRKNINMTVEESLVVFDEVATAFRAAIKDRPLQKGPWAPTEQEEFFGTAGSTEDAHGWIRGYVSTAFQCPYAGRIEPSAVLNVCRRLLQIGVDELSLGDTIGVATPKEVRALTKLLLTEIPKEKIAYHFHDTNGTAMANVACALEDGIPSFDSSAAGLGGCPYAPGAGGNLATEDLVYFLEREGISTGVDLTKLAQASLKILAELGRPPTAKAQLAALARCAPIAGA